MEPGNSNMDYREKTTDYKENSYTVLSFILFVQDYFLA